MTAEVLDVQAAIRGRGRPSNAELTRALGRARLVNVSLREQLHVEQREGRDLAERVRQSALRARYHVQAELLVEALDDASSIAAAADRYLRQRSTGVL